MDEAHCISEWGEDFRPEFRNIEVLRSLLQCPFMAVTATATSAVRKDIMKYLHFQAKDTDIIALIPDRPNIFVDHMLKANGDYILQIQILVEHLKKYGKKAKKCLIYCRTVEMVSNIFINMKDTLQNNAYHEGKKDSDNILIEMFHSATHEKSKARILKAFKSEDSHIRCLVATVAVGMGVQIPDLDLVVHIGTPKSVLSYWQKVGRCARDGRKGYAYLIYDNFSLNQKSTADDIKLFIKNENKECLRKILLQQRKLGGSPSTIGCEDNNIG